MVSVHLLTRHGDRVPIGKTLWGHHLPSEPIKDKDWAKGWVCDPGSISDANVKIQGMSSINDIKFNGKGKCEKEHLTAVGIDQLKQLGTTLRMIYPKQLLAKVSVQITWRQRTYWSAVALMSGLLDSKTPQFVIQTKPIEKDGLVDTYSNCTALKKLSKEITRTKEFIAASRAVAMAAKKYANETSNDKSLIYRAVDDLRCHYCQQSIKSSTGQATNPVFIAIDQIIQAFYFPASWNPPVHRMRIGTYLKELKQHLVDPVKTSNATFLYTSAHDVTISALLSSLNVTITETPPYASNLIIEQWKKKRKCPNQSRPKSMLRLIYNGSPILLPWCKDPCPVENFLRYLTQLGIHLSNESHPEFDFEAECDAAINL